MIKVAKCKIAVTVEDAAALRATMQTFSEAANEARAYAKGNGIRRKFSLHAAIFKPLRIKYQLTSNYAVRACDRAIESVKGNAFKPTSLTIDKSLCRYIEPTEQISVATNHGRRKMQLAIGEYQREMLRGTKGAVGTLNYDRFTNQFFVSIRVKL